jgi:FkbM family methyltransferase
VRRRLPAQVGALALYVSPDSQLKYLKPGIQAFEETLIQMVVEHIKIDSNVWDIGANVGVFAFAAAGVARKGQVLAVEPDIWLAQLLRRSVSLQRGDVANIRVLSAAVADSDGVAEFIIAKRGRASNYLAATGGWTQSGGERERACVATLTLDTLLNAFAQPTFVKIDTEGAEVLALRGATKLLAEVRPTLYLEVGKENAEEASRILASAGYRLFDGRGAPTEGRQALSSCVQDTLAVPAERCPG